MSGDGYTEAFHEFVSASIAVWREIDRDLYCGAGGAGYGYWLAGFEVVAGPTRAQQIRPAASWASTG
jgi:hypothetical protein